MYDMFIGGVSGTLEPVATTALRELGEELGLGPYGGSSSVPDRGTLGLGVLVSFGLLRCFLEFFYKTSAVYVRPVAKSSFQGDCLLL